MRSLLPSAFAQLAVALFLASCFKLHAMAAIVAEDYILPKLQLAAAQQAHSSNGEQSRPGSPAGLAEARSPKRRGRSDAKQDGSGSDGELDSSGSDGELLGSPPRQHMLLGRYDGAQLGPSCFIAGTPVSAGLSPTLARTLEMGPSCTDVFAMPTGLLPKDSSSSSSSPSSRNRSNSSSPDVCGSGGSWVSSSGGRARAPPTWCASPQQRTDVLEAKLQAEMEARHVLQRHLADQSSQAEAQRQALAREYEAKLAALRQEVQDGAAAAAQSTQVPLPGEAHCPGKMKRDARTELRMLLLLVRC